MVLGHPFAGLFLFVLATLGYIFVIPGLIVHLYAIVRAHNIGREQHINDIRRAMRG